MTVQFVLSRLIQKNNLSQEESLELLQLLAIEATPSQIAGILSALASKGEVVDEVVGFIQGIREKAVRVSVPKETVDVCGIGGDGKHTFNISTAVAFVVAGVGVPVAKHGNRAASSVCGSADVLEALGIHITLTARQAEEVLKKVGLVFLFAPLFHPTFKQVGQVRKELGIRTIFNILGPFTSPAGVRRQVVGVPSIQLAQMLAEVAQRLSYEHLCIVTGEDGMDEVSLGAKTIVHEIKGTQHTASFLNPKNFGFSYVPYTKLEGGSAQTNAEIILNVLGGEKSPQRDIVVLNSAVALYVSGKAKTIDEGIALACESIDSGLAQRVLKQLQKETQMYAK